ncbi:hypothetical protein G3N56_02765 [Desulfovibrio sulfodismutans]|uniref:DUF3617 family protein n=1 Tax=Desulfolutivibrio sulfodismutans TaxID=63561 RepID=A0A7K3NIL1_9BACT|nr:hypothetical protein [Desulfolutivibrio sulfodismutans]NDY55663.1 hypothetical protein [Desulfolutivibrio sulfodismutans]QLA13690.1 hypothetical protein GD606_16195 [Desulfolutivibrio sulfodismutans DSM 3696]
MPHARRPTPAGTRLRRAARRLLPALCLVLAAMLPAMAQTLAPDTISGLYVHSSDPRATIKLLLAPSEKAGQPVDRVWGVMSFKDPKAKADSCMFEFQSTVKSNVITCRDAMNPGCEIRLRLEDRTVILDAAPTCFSVYCKGQGMILEGVYTRTGKGGKKPGQP